MSNTFYIQSFIAILHEISEGLIQVDENTAIGELFGEEFDDVDFDMSLCCFEATHRLAFKEVLFKKVIEDYEDLTLEEFFDQFLDHTEQKDPLFVTRRFLIFQESLTDILLNPPPSNRDY